MARSQSAARLAHIPLYPWFIAAYPALQLVAHNVGQVGVQQVLRPLAASLIVATLGYYVLLKLTRDRHRAALLISLLLVLFFSYGQLYEVLRETRVFGLLVGRHRYLAVLYVLLLIGGVWLVLRARDAAAKLTPLLNVFAVALLVIPIFRIGDHQLSQARASSGQTQGGALQFDTEELPDIYYIILDGYARGDALLEDLRYDNSEFLSNLEQLGFYVAPCARSNYARTEYSLTSALNLEYMPTIQQNLVEQGLDPNETRPLVRQSLVRSQLEELGYRAVAFQTGYDWSDWRDADVYLSAARHPLDLSRYSAFEALFLETTALKLWLDTRYALALADDHDVGIRYGGHIELQTNILDQLPGVASIGEPTFTFAHLLIPHHPYIFGPEGEIRSDPGFFSGEDSTPIDDRYQRIGYTGGVEFVNQRMLEIVEYLIEGSDRPPIIVIQGDHGLRDDNRFEVLSAYYLPGSEGPLAYSEITPVNTFRLIFDRYFGTGHGLLPDISYNEDDDINRPIPETSPMCVAEA